MMKYKKIYGHDIQIDFAGDTKSLINVYAEIQDEIRELGLVQDAEFYPDGGDLHIYCSDGVDLDSISDKAVEIVNAKLEKVRLLKLAKARKELDEARNKVKELEKKLEDENE